jgi:hypothetical protein
MPDRGDWFFCAGYLTASSTLRRLISQRQNQGDVMTTNELQERYPKLFGQLEDKDMALRNLVTVDENDNDIDDDELTDELYDPSVYSHMVYIHETVASAIGEHLLSIPDLMNKRYDFKECYDSEGDLWGVVTELDEDQIALAILDEIEGSLG